MTIGLGINRPQGAGGSLLLFTKPEGFNWNYESEFSIKQRGRKYYTDFNGSAFKNPSGATYYVDPMASGANDGSSWGDAFTTIESALTASNAARIYLAPGYYDWNACGWLNGMPTFNRDCTIICEGGKAILHTSQDAAFSWSAEGTANVYQTIYNAFYEVIDRTNVNARGVPIPLDKVASIAEVSANPGSYYYHSGSATLYVHTHDSRAPDSYIMAFRQKNNMDIRAAHNIYFENIEFWGGTYPIVFNNVDGNGKHILCNNCAAHYGPFGGFLFRDISRVSLINWHAEYNELDGAAYRQNIHATQTDILEVNGRSFNNGIYNHNNAYNDIVNGSSAHDGCRIIRLNGTYSQNDGSQIGDTHSGTQSLNLGTNAGESYAATQEGSTDTGYRCTNFAEMWLENASASGSYFDRVNSATMTDLGGFSGNGPGGDSGIIV